MHRSVHRHVNRLALWAVLAIALLPTMGRLWGVPQAPTHAAHRLAPAARDAADAAPHAASTREARSDRLAGHPAAHGEDCDYCLLAAGFALAGASPAALFDAPGGGDAWPLQAVGRHAGTGPAGLGARGPPRAA